MSHRSVSEIYTPPAPNSLQDQPATGHYDMWGYAIGYEVDPHGESVPAGGNTAVFRVFPGGMTEPVFVTKPEADATFTVFTLSGEGEMIRSTADGAVEQVKLGAGAQVVVRPGEAYLYRNTGDRDLVLYDVAWPAFQAGDDAELAVSKLPNGQAPSPSDGYSVCITETLTGERLHVEVPTAFFELVGQALLAHS